MGIAKSGSSEILFINIGVGCSLPFYSKAVFSRELKGTLPPGHGSSYCENNTTRRNCTSEKRVQRKLRAGFPLYSHLKSFRMDCTHWLCKNNPWKISQNFKSNWAWWLMTRILDLKRQMQQECTKFKTNQDYIVRPCLKTTIKPQKTTPQVK